MIKKVVKSISRIFPDNLYIRMQYRYNMKVGLNLANPKRFTEKMQWLKLYDRKAEYTILVDKFLVKDYVSKKIGKKYIIPLLGVWDKFDDIDFSLLPNQFVLKANNSSSGNYICKDKKTIDLLDARRKIDKAVKHNVFWYGREWPYKHIVPKIIAEEYLEDKSGGLEDYKVLCFDGEPKYIEFHSGRYTDDHIEEFYDCNWNRQPFNQVGMHAGRIPVSKPGCLEEMLRLSRVLSEGFAHIRVDWYWAKEHLYFGELTFFDGAGYEGFVPDEMDFKLGELIKLPIKNSR